MNLLFALLLQTNLKFVPCILHCLTGCCRTNCWWICEPSCETICGQVATRSAWIPGNCCRPISHVACHSSQQLDNPQVEADVRPTRMLSSTVSHSREILFEATF